MNFASLRTAVVAVAAPLAVMFSAPSAWAATISHSVGFNINSETRGDNPQLDFDAVIPLFDPVLGTLNQVDIIYRFDLSLTMSISNRTLNPVPFTLAANNLLVEGPRFFDRFTTSNLVASTQFGDTVINVPAGTERQFGSITVVLPGRAIEEVELTRTFSRTSRPLVIRNIVLRPQGNVAPFVGTGDEILNFLVSTSFPLNLPNSGSFLNGVRSSTSFALEGSVDITYDFTPAPAPVPVPAALPLIISGLAVLGLIGRRRKRTAT